MTKDEAVAAMFASRARVLEAKAVAELRAQDDALERKREAMVASAYAEGRKDEREQFAALLQAVEQILDDGHMNTEDLARLRAAWEAL